LFVEKFVSSVLCGCNMDDLKKINDRLEFYIRAQSFPLGIKMMREGDVLPEKAKVPLKDFGHRIAICQVIFPCYGDRIFAQTEDYEMAFTIPYSRISEVLEGLEGTQKGGIRYPVPSFLRYEGKFPEKYRIIEEDWKE